jgi:hypothetical protein
MDGDCCCNCQQQIKIMCHPWNGQNMVPEFRTATGMSERLAPDRVKFGKGPITKQCGWACTIMGKMDGSNKAVFSDREHGICEMHTPIKQLQKPEEETPRQ